MGSIADTLPDHLDYINYGNALDYFKNSNIATYPYDLSLFDDIFAFLSKKRRPDKYASSILLKYTKNNKTNVKLLKESVFKNLKYRNSFRKLKCRGFSYTLITRFDFCDKLHSRANLRFMLVGHRDIFYPPRVRRYLQRVNNVHFRIGGFPSIAFAIGIMKKTEWYLCTLQSDLFFRNSYIRDHIRGWQRVLFSLIYDKAIRAS